VQYDAPAIDTSKVMDALKAEAVAAGAAFPEKNTAIFIDCFLKMVGWFGRLYDFGIIGMYKTRTGTFFADMAIGQEFMKRGKMPILPHKIKRVTEIAKIMQKAKEKQK
jgi:heterodisulfide reductase subunit C